MCNVCFVWRPAGVSLDLSQPAAALQSQKAQPSAQPLLQTQNNTSQAAASLKQVHTRSWKSLFENPCVLCFTVAVYVLKVVWKTCGPMAGCGNIYLKSNYIQNSKKRFLKVSWTKNYRSREDLTTRERKE